MKEKIIASFLAALMLFAPTALAATALKDYPTFLATDHTLDAYVVVGSAADTADVAGAIDIALRLTELSYTEKTCAGGTTGAVDGLEKDGIGFNNNDIATGSSAGSATYTNAFPSGSLVKSFHYSGLKDSTYKWKSNDYDYREQVDVSGVRMRNDYGTNYINGTVTMVVESGDIFYQYVFEKAINLTTATTAATTGTIASPEYTYPINIKMLGKDFSIVSVGDNQVKMLQGSIGTATATTGITYGTYTVYSDLGSNAAWARCIIKDADGNTKDTLIISQADSKDSTATGLTVKVTAVRALQDGTIVGADVVVGDTTAGVEKTYDTSADVTSTGTASDKFPGETDWGIQVSSSGFASPGSITATTANIQVIYKPTTTQYIKAGNKVSLPNNYGDLGFEGYNTDKFTTITIKPITSISAYNNSADTQAFGNLNGIEITSDPANSIMSKAGNSYSKAYILVNYSYGGSGNIYPAMIGFYDSSKAKIIVNGTFKTPTAASQVHNTLTEPQELVSFLMNATSRLEYSFKLNYGSAGEQDWYLNVSIGPNVTMIQNMTVGTAGTQDISLGFNNKTTPIWIVSAAPEFKLGATLASAEANDVNVTTEGTVNNVGTASQDVVDDKGVTILAPSANSAADTVKLKIPAKTLAAKVYFGKLTAATTTAAVTYKDIVPITTPVAKLDTDAEMAVGGAGRLKNIVTVGGPCINKITAEAMGLTYPACGATSTIPTDKAIIQVVDDIFTTGKKVVIVAGWEATNTRTASSVLQQYGTLLSGITASKVEVTAATTAGITPA